MSGNLPSWMDVDATQKAERRRAFWTNRAADVRSFGYGAGAAAVLLLAAGIYVNWGS